ncbi:hypothetical protein N665_0062s0052 [Sinapis alba]|nr:hypothetical protein N665_0062s0052 [Sinapis alba]
MVMMPLIGNLADRYGIKTLLTLPMCLSILPSAILGYRRDTNFFYAFYMIKTLFDIVCQGAVDCLAQAYVAKNIATRKRISMFGVLAGVKSISGICATFAARFLPVASIFQVSSISSFVAVVHMLVFLKESLHDNDDNDFYDDDRNDQEIHDGGDLRMLAEPILRDAQIKTHVFTSVKNMVSLINNSTILVQALVVTFFATFSQSGMNSAFMYFLKARFGFNKNDFAELMLLVSIIGSISQLFILPILVSAIGERGMLSTGLLMESFSAACLSLAWSPWVPYATTVFVPGVMFVMPSVCGIASRQVGSAEQGKVQGCISGVKSFAEVVAPFVYSPLTALFLSNDAPFYFPGFSLLCISLSWMIGFLQSILIKDVPSSTLNNEISNTSNEEA